MGTLCCHLAYPWIYLAASREGVAMAIFYSCTFTEFTVSVAGVQCIGAAVKIQPWPYQYCSDYGVSEIATRFSPHSI